MQIIDLSRRLYDGLKTHASHPRVIINDFVTHAFSAPRYQAPCRGFATKQLLISDHAGTHVDAPSHFVPEGLSIEQESLDKYLGPALLVDVSYKELRRPVDRELLQEALEKSGLTVQAGAIVLIRAWAGSWDHADFHESAGLEISGARWLVERGAKAIGIDLGNIEDNADMTRKVHVFLLGAQVPIYENLANLEALPAGQRFYFMGLPLALTGCTGSPVRAVALVGKGAPC